jgi:hypothetical protein
MNPATSIRAATPRAPQAALDGLTSVEAEALGAFALFAVPASTWAPGPAAAVDLVNWLATATSGAVGNGAG